MRLTHIKLAGFKSFVDPATIHVHGQRVGIVGPNGCGKSNVMESVRWVLGESSAKEMRADSMDSVIFNGSANRQAISRASVELLFDNSMGGAAGEWGQYAEISVKRVIEREKGSSYYINNTAVRRRDVADLFLGTGLGGRAYAIIGQNTISRIVEAKPEELRVFLEEAAGISKYKERRRETEFRLRDTRENLTRVEDIVRELQKQINKLEAQALVAEQYHKLQAELKQAEAQLWWLKKRDAARDWDKTKHAVERLVTTLEAAIADLRAAESAAETARQRHYAASEGINSAQAKYYEANADVSNLENQVRQSSEARERLSQQLQQLHSALERNLTQLQALQQQQVTITQEAQEADKLELAANSELKALQAGLPEKDTQLKTANQALEAANQALNDTRQKIQLGHNQIGFLQQSMQEAQARQTRFKNDLASLQLPDDAALSAAQAAIAEQRTQIELQSKTIQTLQAQESALNGDITQLRQQQNEAQRALHQAEAEANSLAKLLNSANQEGKLGAWLAQHNLAGAKRLFSQIQIDGAWTQALEAALGARLNALSSASQVKERPPAGLVMSFAGDMVPHSANPAFKLLLAHIACKDASMQGVLQDWLCHVYVTDDEDVRVQAGALRPGELLVNKHGDLATRYSVQYHAAQRDVQGMLERQQQLEAVQSNLPTLQANAKNMGEKLLQQEQALQALRPQQQQAQAALSASNSGLHKAEMALNNLQQVRQNIMQRQQNAQAEVVAAAQKITELAEKMRAQEAENQSKQAQTAGLEANKQAALTQKQQAESLYFALREDIQAAEKKQQACFYNKKIINNTINELNNKIKQNSDEKASLTHRQKESEEALKVVVMDTLKAHLAEAIQKKEAAEQNLIAARNTMAEDERTLQESERKRLQAEHALAPQREALEQSRLKEQEARIYFEQCQQGLAETGMDETVLANSVNEETKAGDLLRTTNQLSNKINALGAVNLAAIEELAAEKERKTYLDSQMTDLLDASQTLEDAINKIDKETRGKLQATYDAANRNFNELFNVLFNGGQARLQLQGDEILDTGVEVFAQPPGKKNTTIQMLSGGEKALTAMALVFALFRLNPAPFCLLDEVDAPLDDSNTERFCGMVKKMAEKTQFLFVSHNKITMEMAQQLIGVTMQESGVSRVVDVDLNAAIQMQEV